MSDFSATSWTTDSCKRLRRSCRPRAAICSANKMIIIAESRLVDSVHDDDARRVAGSSPDYFWFLLSHHVAPMIPLRNALSSNPRTDPWIDTVGSFMVKTTKTMRTTSARSFERSTGPTAALGIFV